MGNICSSVSCGLCSRWPPMKVLIMGPTDAGKTTLFFRLTCSEVVNTVSTMGYNLETIETTYKNRRVDINAWDFGSHVAVRPLIGHCLEDTSAIVFVLDRTDVDSMSQLEDFLQYIRDPKVVSKPLLILLNKQDLEKEQVITRTAIREMPAVQKMEAERVVEILPTSGKTGEGLHEALEWLAEAVLVRTGQPGVVAKPETGFRWWLETGKHALFLGVNSLKGHDHGSCGTS